MSRQRVVDLLPAASVAAGGATVSLSDTERWSVITQGTFVATLQVQVSYDGGTTWVQTGANQTAPGVLDGTTLAPQMRINTSAFTSGVPAARVILRESQQLF